MIGSLRSFPRQYGEWVVRWRWTVLLGSVALALGLALPAASQRFHNPYDIWFLPTDPSLASYRQLTRQYGEDDFVIVAFRDPEGIFTNRALRTVVDLAERLERTVFVEKVTSVANYQYARARRSAGREDEILVDDLVKKDELPLSPGELRRREEIALSEKPVVGSLLSPAVDGHRPTTTAVVARVTIRDDQPENAVKVVDAIQAVAREIEARHGYELSVAGVPVVEHAFATFGRREAITYTSLLVVTVAVLLGLAFRSLQGVVLPCGVVLLSIGPALGVMALLGLWLNPLTSTIPQTLVTVAIAEAVHLVATFREQRQRGARREAAVVEAVTLNFAACTVTTVTTVIGFASLVTATVVPMRQFGVGAAVGVGFAWVLSFTFLPALLAVWPDRPSSAPRLPVARAAGIDRFLEGCAAAVARRPWTVVWLTVAAFAAIMAFALRLHVETSYKNMFKADTPVRRGVAFVEGNLGGSEDVEVSVDSGRSDGVKDPAFLEKLKEIQGFLAIQPGVSHTFSIADILERMNQVMHDDDPGQRRLPDRADLAAQYLLLYTLGSRNEDLKDRIDVDGRWARVSARMRAKSSAETLALGERVRGFLRERFPELRANVTGKALLYTALQEEMARSVISSFLTAAVPITVVQALLFRSFTIGALSMVPNFLPILAVVGLMGLFRIPLDPGSAMVASVGIGIVVDDTVHFFARYLRSRRQGVPPPEAVRRTLVEVGRPVLYTTFILALGFGLFGLSRFTFIAYFGQLAATVIVLALLADLFLTPALLLLVDGRRERLARGMRRGAATIGGAVVIAVALGTGPVQAGEAEDRGLGIVREQERVNRGYGSEIVTFRMVLVNANKDRSERVMEMRILEGDGEGDRTVIVFKAPPDINGTGLLTHQNRQGDDDQWLYLPALRRVKRIGSASRSSAFVGSELTYEDLTPREIAKYDHRLLREDTVTGAAVWVVESVPRFKDSGYSRVELFVRKDNHQTVRANFYDKKGDLLKVGRFEEWTRVDARWWRSHTTRMDNAQTGKSTVLERLETRIGAGLGARDFTTRALEQ